MRANALTIIHKFIRRELFDVSARLAGAGPEDIGAVRTAIAEVIELLHAHAAHEESGIEPQVREHSAAHAERLLHDHHRLHAELDAIGAAAQVLDAAPHDACVATLLQLHLDWNRFVGGYLLHLDDEERTWFAHLGDFLPPVAFMAEAARMQGEEQGKAFLEKLWKVVTPDERAIIEQARGGS
ncbi:MAG TPA: hemerythrin domain-containing protein [Gammaproteobacteria bacterium]